MLAYVHYSALICRLVVYKGCAGGGGVVLGGTLRFRTMDTMQQLPGVFSLGNSNVYQSLL